jgi:7-cyano-7-deazaguanine synthase in queuosine biosynthesis
MAKAKRKRQMKIQYSDPIIENVDGEIVTVSETITATSDDLGTKLGEQTFSNTFNTSDPLYRDKVKEYFIAKSALFEIAMKAKFDEETKLISLKKDLETAYAGKAG